MQLPFHWDNWDDNRAVCLTKGTVRIFYLPLVWLIAPTFTSHVGVEGKFFSSALVQIEKVGTSNQTMPCCL